MNRILLTVALTIGLAAGCRRSRDGSGPAAGETESGTLSADGAVWMSFGPNEDRLVISPDIQVIGDSDNGEVITAEALRNDMAIAAETAEDRNETWIPYEGPPAGTDLDGDGTPDLLIYDYSGGAHCCTSVKHIVCSDPPVLVAQIAGWHDVPVYKDVDNDGRYEMSLCDSSYAYWNACFACSPMPRVIYRIERGRCEMAGDLMAGGGPGRQETEAYIRKWQQTLQRFSEIDRKCRQNPDYNLTPEEGEVVDLFWGMTWHTEDGVVCIPPDVWGFLLDLIYSGRIHEAAAALDAVWPGDWGYRNTFANDLLE